MEMLTYQWGWNRIDKRLTEEFPYSRNFFHHIISRDWVQINGKVVKKSYKLKNNDKITIDDLKRYLSPIILEESPKIDLPIVLEKEDYLVINKSKWVLSHPNSIWDVDSPSVVWFLYHHYKNLPTIWTFIRAGLIHRLDKDTDWLMIIVKTEKWLAHFKKLFQAKSEAKDINEKEKVNLKKFYRANCYQNNVWIAFLDSIKDNLPYVLTELVVPKTPNSISKIWITKILSFENTWNTTKIKLEILTWRTHQIRYHLSNHWLPIIWDYLYGEEEEQQMQLTARKLIFKDPEWEQISLEI